MPWSGSAAAAGRVPAGRPAHAAGKRAQRHAGGQPGRILAAKRLRAQGRVIPWRHAGIYAALVLAVAVAIAAWDRAYQGQFRAPSPDALARSLVENFIGPGTVHAVSLDAKAHTLDMAVEDVLVKPGQSKADERQNLTKESALTVGVLQSQMKGLRKITVHIVKANKPLVTATVEGNAGTPALDFAPDLR
jgi:hypothetical protein